MPPWTAAEITERIKAAAARYGSGNPQQIQQFLWALERADPDETCRGLLGVFQENDFECQQFAGLLLARLQPPCKDDLQRIVYSVLATWNLSVEELPFYLARAFGRPALLDALHDMERETRSETEQRAIATFRFWLGRSEAG